VRQGPFFLMLGVVACAAPLKPLPPPASASVPEDPEALAAQAREAARQSQRDPSADNRRALAETAVEAGQRCQQATPTSPACAYALALALGVQARERPATATQGLKLMVELLQQAKRGDAKQDHAGPARVLALVLVRAPGWPLGPGDPEAGLEASRQAVTLFPDYPPNQLALSEALLVVGEQLASEAAARHALDLARAAATAGSERDADDWVRDGEALLAGKPPR
jgi:hypothetical protein